MRKPDLRRPVAGPYRQSRLMAVLEVAFGWVAKGTMVLAGLAIVVLMAMAGAPDLPTTRKGWLHLLLMIAVLLVLVCAFVYYWPGPANAHAAGG
ncbi:hypothetical protein DIE21_33765 [Burkholderia sp. Bp9140]|uniref:hypothetical protein n=1 Tax=Burkholderia sp. Bp9140 TaxID=2184572 RepID=UPI000F55BF74|nr:hypothetical protein [Burkholderia sp. Bp9140]RQR44344.1 hypothetical protein DIE21_33765 [Burkholderia sp. Bp9140]